MAPYSGPTTANGLSLLAGARLAEDEVNRAGGVDGYRVEIVALDERNPASPADLVVDPDVVAVVGHLLPGAGAAESTYRAGGIAWLAAEPVDPGVGRYPLVAGPVTVDRLAVEALPMDPTSPPLNAMAQCGAGQAAAGGVVFIGSTELLCGLPAERLAATLDEISPPRHVICVGGCDAPEIETWASGLSFDYVAPVAPPATPSADWTRFVARLSGSAPSPEYAALGYDGVNLVVAAARRAAAGGAPGRASVGRELARTDYRGLLATYRANGPAQVTAELRNSRSGMLARLTEQR